MLEKSKAGRTARRGAASIVAIATVGILLASSASAALERRALQEQHHALTSITLAQPTSTLLYAPIYIAEARGLFQKNGLDVKTVITGGTPTAIAAVLAGSAQIAGGGLSDNMAAAAQGKPLVSFATFVDKNPDDIVVSKSFAQSRNLTSSSPLAAKVKALKGATIGITSAGSLPEQFIDWLLPQYGLDPKKDVTFVALHDPSTALATMDHGRIDAIVFPPPAPQTAILDGSAVMWVNTAHGEVKPGYQVGLMASASYIKSHPGVVRAVTKSIAEAQQYIFANRRVSGSLVEQYFKDEPAKAFTLAWANQIQALTARPDVTKAQYDAVVSFLRNAGRPVADNITYSMVATNSLALAADKQIAPKKKTKKK